MTTLLSESQVHTAAERIQKLSDGLNACILGQSELINHVVVGFLSGGHVL